MWFPRVKIYISNSIDNKYYNVDKWYYITNFKTKKLYFRYRKDNRLEFVIDSYKNKQEALKNGKILYSNVLFYGYKSFFDFEMGDRFYITSLYDEWYDCTKEEYIKNEEWFFDTKNNSCDSLGLSIFKGDNINDLDSYQSIEVEMKAFLKESIDIVVGLHNLDYDLKYTEKIQKIFHMFELVEESDTNTKILLLCQILEIMGINSDKSEEAKSLIIKFQKIVDRSDLSILEKQSLRGGLETLKRESSSKKIKKLINKYCNKDYTFNKKKLIDECYTLRSLIIHGEKIKDKNNVYNLACKLKIITLDTFKEWSKHNS